MRTSEDASQSGLYASDCCGKELFFTRDATFWRCPQCHRLCDWEPVRITGSPAERENLQSTRSNSAVA